MRRLFAILLVLLGTAARADRAAFLRAIAADPRDFTARLVYADWLDENGDPDRATFIRAQVYVEVNGSMLHWGRPLITGDDSAHFPPPRAFLETDSFFDAEDANVYLYRNVETPAVVEAERTSRELFRKHWRRWVDEIDPDFRRQLHPNFITHPDDTQRRLGLLSSHDDSAMMHWWYPRFRAGFFGAVQLEDFVVTERGPMDAIFDRTRSTVIELHVRSSQRTRFADYARAHPEALKRLHSLSLWATMSSDTSRTDRVTAALFGERNIRSGLKGLTNFRLVTTGADEGNAVALGSLAPDRLAAYLDQWMAVAKPKRFFLCNGLEAPLLAHTLVARVLDPKRTSFTEQLTTLAMTAIPTVLPLQQDSIDFLQRLSSVETLHIGNWLTSNNTKHTKAHYEALSRLPKLRVLSWDVLSTYRPPAPTEDAFPSLRDEPNQGWHVWISEALKAVIERNRARCAESLADLAFLNRQ